MSLHGETYERQLLWRHRMGQLFEWLCRLATVGALAMLLVLLGSIIVTALTPGRGKGLAAVSITGESSTEIQSFRVSSVKGGQFEFKDQPERKITEFTVEDLRNNRIVFDHSGKRANSVFDLEATVAGERQPRIEEVGSAETKPTIPVPKIHAPLPAKPWGWLTWGFLTTYNSYDPLEAGILAGLWGSIWLTLLAGLMAVPLGVGAAVYLEEYAKPTLLTKVIQLNIANLAGVPSIVYGILGLSVFTHMFGAFDRAKESPHGLFRLLTIVLNLIGIGYDVDNPGFVFNWWGLDGLKIPLPWGPVLLSGACTLALLSLPVVIISSQEALRSVPASLRHASFALGATKWQTIWHQVLPAALPGILTGVILSLSRAIGEAAPLAVIGVSAQLGYAPGGITGIGDIVRNPAKLLKAPFDRFTALPTQVYSWITEASPNFEHVAAAGILVLLATLLTMNGIAIFIRQRFSQKIRW